MTWHNIAPLRPNQRVAAAQLLTRAYLHPSYPQAMAVNLWVLAIMGGIVGIIIVGKGRIHVPEPLARVHATNGVLPFVMPVESDSM